MGRHLASRKLAAGLIGWIATVSCLCAGTFSRLQLLLPGETAAPGTATGKTGNPYIQITNAPFVATVNAVDANWNLVDTNDVVRVVSSDASAILPANMALVAGTKTFSVSLMTPGFASIRVSDLTHPTITSNVSPDIAVTLQQTPVTVFDFTYANRLALLAAGWNFLARNTNGTTRNTEITNGGTGQVISYDQAAHPGVLQIPAGTGDLWLELNNTRNSLFRNLPTNWTSLQLDLSFAPTWPYQQVNLALYQDDDNYVEVGVVHSHAVAVVQETNQFGSALTSLAITGTAVQLRLDRDLNYGDISSYYSLDGTNWVFAAKTGQELVNPRLCIWAGGSQSGSPNVDLRQLRIATNAAPFPSTLALQPVALVFNSSVGQANTNIQRVNIYHRGPDGFKWNVTKNASWLSVSSSGGGVPGFCDVSVNTSGLSSGVYQAVLNFTAFGAVTNVTTVPVTLIVNANTRAKVATWRGGKKGAMSIWIDDSDQTMFDLLQAGGFNGTYALWSVSPIPSIFTSWFHAGMELGSHTFSHPCFPLDQPARRAQFENNLADIIASTPQTQDRLTSFAWPCGANTTREKVWAADYFLISRGYNINQLEDASPQDFMNVKSYNSHEHDPGPPSDLKTVVNAAITQGKWANLVFHTMNNDDGAVAYAVGKDIWVGTGGDVTRYILQRDRTIISNYVQTAAQIQFDCVRLEIPPSNRRSFEAAFDANDTITFQVAVTNLAPVAGVSVGGFARPYTIRSTGGTTNLFFDALISSSAQTVLITLSNSPVLTVTADNKAKVYRQSNPTLTGTVVGVLGGDNITATFTTTATTSSAVGAYPIKPVLSDPNGRLGNYNVITNNGILTITKSNAPIALGNLSGVFNGSGHGATATTVPSGLTVNFTYNGQTAAPVNAGSYQVIGTISAANYAGSATNTLAIAKSNIAVTLGNLSQVYNGLGHSATATTAPLGLTVNFTYDGLAAAPTNAGSFQVVGTISDVNYTGGATNTLVIARSNAAVSLTGLSQIYDGTARVASASTVPTGLSVSLTYDSSLGGAVFTGSTAAPTNAGSYEVIGTISDVNYAGAATNTLVIETHPLSVKAQDASRMYGQANPVFTGSITGVQSGDNISASYSATATVNSPPGHYDIVPTLVDPDDRLSNYVVTEANGLLTIVGAPQFLSIARTPTGTVNLVCEVYVGRKYVFQYKSSLADPDWTTFATQNTIVSPTVEVSDNSGSNPQRFYRALDVTDP